MSAQFAPIRYPDVIAAPTLAHSSLLEPARIQPNYVAMDDVGQYSETMPRHIKPADPDDFFSQDEDAEEALTNAVEDGDTLAALSWLHANKVLPDHVWHVINEAAMEFAEKRLNRSQA